MGKTLEYGAIRIAVKDEKTNKKMINIIKQVMVRLLNGTPGSKELGTSTLYHMK